MKTLLATLCFCAAIGPWARAAAPTVKVARDDAGRWQILRDGRPFVMKGIGGYSRLELAVASGATTIRTWGSDNLAAVVDGKPLVERAHELGLAILAGLWLTHERQGMNYDDPAQLQAQRERVRAEIRRYRDQPAILAWGLGNEVEGASSPTGEVRVWRELEVLARLVKEEDPRRPVTTAIAGASLEKIRAIKQYCPSLDILGLNLYGGAPMVTVQLDDAGWDRPFLLGEFGATGAWEVMQTPWGAPLEPNTAAKVNSYFTAYRCAQTDRAGRCVGAFAFVWGHKQETTATWFGMFLPTGEKTPMVDIMAREFTGRWPANRCPAIGGFHPSFARERVGPGVEVPVKVEASDPEGDPLTYEWVVMAESASRPDGGGYEPVPAKHPECIIRQDGPRAVVRTPAAPGAYRLFVYVRDGRGGGCSENTPFFVGP